MPSFVETPTDDPVSAALLDEYFTSRELGFVSPDGRSYLRAGPDPARFVRPAGVFVLVRDGDEAVGCGGVRMLSPTRGELKHIWLQPRTRGRGWGRALLVELERLAADLGATEVVLDTNSSLEAAGHLYRSSGYRSIEPYNDNPNATDWFGKRLG